MSVCRYAKFFVVLMLALVLVFGGAQILHIINLDETAFGGYFFVLIIGLLLFALCMFLVCSLKNRIDWKTDFPKAKFLTHPQLSKFRV